MHFLPIRIHAVYFILGVLILNILILTAFVVHPQFVGGIKHRIADIGTCHRNGVRYRSKRTGRPIGLNHILSFLFAPLPPIRGVHSKGLDVMPAVVGPAIQGRNKFVSGRGV